MGIFGSLLGFVLGVVVVRAFMLDNVEELGWRIFWSEVQGGRAGELGNVASSATFLKCFVGGIVGAALGGFVGERMGGVPTDPKTGLPPLKVETKKCPFCAEEIMKEAVVCKHCNRDVPTQAT
ncbi:hypothetical protein [Ramlibacter sp. WS9]|uniref:hypothetical protein n=1 Tax=Ramlibacter sp. WS9 TaxID=1882741 RepID=UPI00114398ED|nr:hypothetical protein [Ramlibacter sp. WS9]ROZ64572.1 hypothetical protein EEB15_28450 [Ramlibacter sp. WS9]